MALINLQRPVAGLFLVLLAACTSSPPPSRAELPTCTFNIGDTVQPQGGMGAKVPEPGNSVSGHGDDFQGGGSSITIDTSKAGVVSITKSKNGVNLPPESCRLANTSPDESWETIVLSDSIRFAPPSAGSEAHDLSSEEALAAYRAVNKEFHPASEMTSRLGLFTNSDYVRSDGTHPYRNRLAWGYSWRSVCPLPPIGPGQSPPSPDPAGCIAWLFLDAKTGKMLVGLYQQ